MKRGEKTEGAGGILCVEKCRDKMEVGDCRKTPAHELWRQRTSIGLSVDAKKDPPGGRGGGLRVGDALNYITQE